MGVNFDVFVADLDVEDEVSFEVLEVDFAYRAAGGGLGGGDAGVFAAD